MTAALERIRLIMDRLDTEDDQRVRADLIDEAIGLADSDAQCLHEWEAYR